MADIAVSADIHSFMQAANAAAACTVLGAADLGANTFTATQTITLAAANTGVLASTGYSLTGSDATSMIDLAGTWDTSGTPTALKLNLTDTASGSSSLLMDLQVGGASKLSVTKAGFLSVRQFVATDASGVNGIQIWNGSGGGYALCHTNFILGWTADTNNGTIDAAFTRNAGGVLEINNGAAGTYRDLKVRDIIINSGTMVKSSTAFTDGSAAQTATMTNGPAAGNPTKWIPINDNGTTRYIPAW